MAELGLDPARLSAFGRDVGGSFVHRLAAELPLTAGAVFAGTLGTTSPGGGAAVARPVAVAPVTMILAHGDNDAVFPVDGGLGTRGEEVTSFDLAFAFWRAASGCTGTPIENATVQSRTGKVACNGVTVMATRWRDAKHIIPDSDPENPELAVTAIIERLLAAR